MMEAAHASEISVNLYETSPDPAVGATIASSAFLLPESTLTIALGAHPHVFRMMQNKELVFLK